MKKSFTLFEILIVVALIGIIAASAPLTIDFMKQISKGYDSRRKSELSALSSVLEDFYNDNNRYPLPAEICFDDDGSSTTCHICGNQTTSPSFTPYLQRIPCDPQSPRRNYLYEVNSYSFPASYWIYTELSNGEGPGIGPGSNYNYGVSSGNTSL